MLEITDIYENIINSINNNATPIIGIDGLGGAGKSTISEKLCRIFEEKDYRTVLLHIDDFIHVREVRYNDEYPDWKCYYDLQWRYDYFLDVVNEIKNSDREYIDIELYDKDNDTYFDQRFEIGHKTIVIAEGIFLQKKEYNNIFDYMIYIDIPEEERLNRVLKRDT